MQAQSYNFRNYVHIEATGKKENPLTHPGQMMLASLLLLHLKPKPILFPHQIHLRKQTVFCERTHFEMHICTVYLIRSPEMKNNQNY